MKEFLDLYDTSNEQSYDEKLLRFFFVSKGKKDIVKAIDYQYVGPFEGRTLFNLAFGDYDVENGTVSDHDTSNNGDAFKVFHTVLNTVPALFDTFGNSILMVQGSDSKPEFIAACREECKRRCVVDECKKAHRRINIYRGFVDKNMEDLNKEYVFLGGEDIDNENIIEPYVRYKKYNTVFVMKKNA